MADPISIAVGIFSIASASIKLSTAVYDITDRLSSAHENIETLAIDLSFFSVVLDELGKILDVPKSKCIASDRLFGSIKNICEECKNLHKINKKITKSKSTRKFNFKTKVRCIFEEGKVARIKASLDGLKATLGVVSQGYHIRAR
ncbi:hypothetical protein BDZ45DRAFT_751600 [Acephala macrosclerotiorum]|nr:hypothetical protein BDZ45DRAFT_751600 [Acephala macrosclerotiorum]